jgi:hypothetical protein
MADTQRTRAALLALLADNTTGQISAQDLRDLMVTIMDADFVNPGDFWSEPRSGVNCTMSDKTVKGWIEYSQLILSDISFGRVAYLTPSGWAPASGLTSTQNQMLAVAADSYAATYSQAQMLRRGLVYDSALSARFSGNIGKYIVLVSGSYYGSISVTFNTGSNRVVGMVELSGWSDVTSGKWRFDPTWAAIGV